MTIKPDEWSQAVVGFFNYAHSYAISGRELQLQKVACTHHEAPARFLFFHSIELYLKCYLLAEGFTLKELGGRELGHNVFSLSEKCADNGLKIARDYREILEKIQNWDSAIQTRYLKIGIRKEIVTDALYATCCYLHRKTAYFAYRDYPSLPKPALQQLTTSELSQLGLQE